MLIDIKFSLKKKGDVVAVSKYQNRMPKVARKAFNMGEVWNPVCCHSNRTVKLILWRTFRRTLLPKLKNF